MKTKVYGVMLSFNGNKTLNKHFKMYLIFV